MKKKVSIKNPKRTKLILRISVLLLAIPFSFLVADYINYHRLNHSRFFGSKDIYAQNESLYYEDIKLTVTNVWHSEHPPTTYKECYDSKNNKYATWFRSFDECMEDAKAYDERKVISVFYTIENLSNKPISLNEYKPYISGADGIPFNEPEEKQYDLLAKQTRENSIVLDVGKEVEGPIALIVSKDHKQKQIDLELSPLIEY